MDIQFSALMAELADAAYAKFDVKNVEEALAARKFSDTQIATFIQTPWGLPLKSQGRLGW